MCISIDVFYLRSIVMSIRTTHRSRGGHGARFAVVLLLTHHWTLQPEILNQFIFSNYITVMVINGEFAFVVHGACREPGLS